MWLKSNSRFVLFFLGMHFLHFDFGHQIAKKMKCVDEPWKGRAYMSALTISRSRYMWLIWILQQIMSANFHHRIVAVQLHPIIRWVYFWWQWKMNLSFFFASLHWNDVQKQTHTCNTFVCTYTYVLPVALVYQISSASLNVISGHSLLYTIDVVSIRPKRTTLLNCCVHCTVYTIIFFYVVRIVYMKYKCQISNNEKHIRITKQ